jgi:hypothetical protein
LVIIPLIIVIIAIFIEVTGFFLPLSPYIKGIIITSILGFIYMFYFSDIQRLKISQKT